MKYDIAFIGMSLQLLIRIEPTIKAPELTIDMQELPLTLGPPTDQAHVSALQESVKVLAVSIYSTSPQHTS